MCIYEHTHFVLIKKNDCISIFRIRSLQFVVIFVTYKLFNTFSQYRSVNKWNYLYNITIYNIINYKENVDKTFFLCF